MSDFYSEDFRRLNKSMLEQKLVVFVGAGVSMGSGLLSWNGLTNEIKKTLGDTSFTQNDNTIIPQLYYNSRGKKEYIELIKDLLFNSDIKPNIIHDKIVKLKPRYVITTNYDNLIEKAFYNNGEFLDVVERDSDLPYVQSDRMIIKMHGGFKYNNFVLKEDDYLSYHNNFILIENYIKALFSRYTILFIGYSFNDPDTKQILNWVRDILKEDQQRAYLIDIEHDADQQIHEYYKNMGINLIYAKQFKNIPTDKTEITSLILDKIIMPQYNQIAVLNERLKVYDIFNYIPTNYIYEQIRKIYLCYIVNNNLYFYEDNDQIDPSAIKSYLQDDDLNSQYIYILSSLQKSSIEKIIFEKHDKFKYDINHFFDDISLFEEFNYCSIKEKSQTIKQTSFKDRMFLAYCFYYLKDYCKSYSMLSTISDNCLKKGEIDKYVMSEINRINVGKLLVNDYSLKIENEEKSRIEKEIYSKNNNNTYYMYLSNTEKNDIIEDLISLRFIYKSTSEIINIGKTVEEESRTDYIVHSDLPAYKKIEQQVKELYLYMQLNFLLLNVYSETQNLYTMFIDSLLLSLSTKKDIKNNFMHGKSENIVLDKLSRFDVMIICRFVPFKELRSLILKYKIENIALNKESIMYLKLILNNFSDAFNNNIERVFDPHIINKAFILLGNTLSNEDNDSFYKISFILLTNYNYDFEYKYLNDFIVYHFKNGIDLFSHNQIKQLIEASCRNLLNLNQVTISQNYFHLLKNLCSIYEKFPEHENLLFTDVELNRFKLELDIYLLMYLYRICSDHIKKTIKNVILEKLDNNYNNKLYYYSIVCGITEPDLKYETKLFQSAQYTIESSNNQDKTTDHELYDINAPIHCFNLYYIDKLISVEGFKNIIRDDKSLSFMVNPDEYNYDNFDPQELKTFSEKSLEIVSNNRTAYNKIGAILKQNLQSNWDEKLAKIHIKYFCRYEDEIKQ